MRLAIVVEVDDDLLSAYVARSYEEHGPDEQVERVTPALWLRERLQALADDEIPVALWGWPDLLGLTVTVEDAPQP